jgi:hypothetical protein
MTLGSGRENPLNIRDSDVIGQVLIFRRAPCHDPSIVEGEN